MSSCFLLPTVGSLLLCSLKQQQQTASISRLLIRKLFLFVCCVYVSSGLCCCCCRVKHQQRLAWRGRHRHRRPVAVMWRREGPVQAEATSAPPSRLLRRPALQLQYNHHPIITTRLAVGTVAPLSDQMMMQRLPPSVSVHRLDQWKGVGPVHQIVEILVQLVIIRRRGEAQPTRPKRLLPAARLIWNRWVAAATDRRLKDRPEWAVLTHSLVLTSTNFRRRRRHRHPAGTEAVQQRHLTKRRTATFYRLSHRPAVGVTGAALAVKRKANRHQLPQQSAAVKRHPNRRRRHHRSCSATVRTISAAAPPQSPFSRRRRTYQKRPPTTAAASAVGRWSTSLPPPRWRLVQQRQQPMNGQTSVPGRLQRLLSPSWRLPKLQLLLKPNRHRLKKKNQKNPPTRRKTKTATLSDHNLLRVVERRQLEQETVR